MLSGNNDQTFNVPIVSFVLWDVIISFSIVKAISKERKSLLQRTNDDDGKVLEFKLVVIGWVLTYLGNSYFSSL